MKPSNATRNASPVAPLARDASSRAARRHSRLLLLLLALGGLAVLAVLAGCRTYGSRGATEKMLPELRQSVQLFASDLQRARGARSLLAEAAQDDPTLRRVAEEYEQAIAQHEAVLKAHRDVLARFTDDLPGYRTMHRTFGAVLSKHETTRNRYRSLTKAARFPSITMRMNGGSDRTRALPDTLPRARDEAYTKGRYYVEPIFYERLQSTGNDLTMRQALAERRKRQSQSGRLAPPPASSREGATGSSLPPADAAGRVAQ